MNKTGDARALRSDGYAVADVIPDVEMAKPFFDAVHVMLVWRETQVKVPFDVEVP